MSQKKVLEYDAKSLLARWLHRFGDSEKKHVVSGHLLQITPQTKSWDVIARENPWVLKTKLVVKVDQLIKRRGKNGLILVNASWAEVKEWIQARMNKVVTVEGTAGLLHTFLVEPMVSHRQTDEYYLCLHTDRDGDEILFHHEGGVDVGDVDAKARRLRISEDTQPDVEVIRKALLSNLPASRQRQVASFINALMMLYRELHFCYFEINPLVVLDDGRVVVLDVASIIDECAEYLCHEKWGDLDFATPFGRPPAKEEAYIHSLDAKTGASLKLTLLNRHGRVWTMVAGGGASVVYADTICDLGFSKELANYGEYSGAPTEAMTYEYARTILDLMTQGKPVDGGKVLIIGGGIANFTDVASTFKGIIRALLAYQKQLQRHNIKIWVRRGGPNYEEGLKNMRACGEKIGVPMSVHGPETDIVEIVPKALRAIAADDMPLSPKRRRRERPSFRLDHIRSEKSTKTAGDKGASRASSPPLFTSKTRCIVYGMQRRAVQGMLDFDYLCKRDSPSVAAIVFPFSSNHYQQFYFGAREVQVPVVSSLKVALETFPSVDVMVNFASFRSAYPSTVSALDFPQLRVIAIIAEGVPERLTRKIGRLADAKGVTIIGPATVGGLTPGAFRIGNTGGMINNIIASKLYRRGSVGYVSRSGGMSNELNSICAKHADGVADGVAIGGDRYPGSRFIDHLVRMERNPAVKILLMLGEVGGVDEYAVCDAIRDGRITKPLVAWCIGTCAGSFSFEVQFGHAGALANGKAETAAAKNAALREAGAVVPGSFDQLPEAIASVYKRLREVGTIRTTKEDLDADPPSMPMDFAWAKKLGLIRKPSNFVTTITDERGDELLYAGVPISKIFKEDRGIGSVISLLWLGRELPAYATKFIEMVLMVTADHGPAVSGAHNTIVTARAGKDLISALCSGLLTIGPRFGGALDEAAKMFGSACQSGVKPKQFVLDMRARRKLIMGIGHKVKSVHNPDSRVEIVKAFAKKHFPCTPTLDFALDVERITTKKKANLILNVDGCIAVCFVDLLRYCGTFTVDEADEIVANGTLNALFVLGRSIGFIGHFLDQKRLKQGLYRHPYDDIAYLSSRVE